MKVIEMGIVLLIGLILAMFRVSKNYLVEPDIDKFLKRKKKETEEKSDEKQSKKPNKIQEKW